MIFNPQPGGGDASVEVCTDNMFEGPGVGGGHSENFILAQNEKVAVESRIDLLS